MLEIGRQRVREERGLAEGGGRFLQEVGFGCRERCLKYLTAGLPSPRSPAEPREAASRGSPAEPQAGPPGVLGRCGALVLTPDSVEKDPPPAPAT